MITNKIFVFIFLAIVTMVLNTTSVKSSERYVISDNGNFLFYNSPVAAKANGYMFISFLTREGLIVVNKYTDPKGTDKIKFLKSYIVHDYSKKIDAKSGWSCDHAAPAIIYDKARNKILLATSYQASDLYVFQYNFEKDIFEPYKVLRGKYTYPKFISWNSNIYLLTKSISADKKMAGDLVLRNSIDDFNSEIIVIPSSNGEAIYASRPTIGKNYFFVSYSIFNYLKMRFTDWKIAKFDLKHPEDAAEIFNLDSFVNKGIYSNRPTSIRYKDGTLIVATSIFIGDESDARFKDRYYNRKNRVLIITINSDNGSFIKKNHDNIVATPYYSTSVDINSEGDYIYFSKDHVYSSKKFSKTCFKNNNFKLYPSFLDQDILYVNINNDSYSIRDFNNSIILCIHPLD